MGSTARAKYLKISYGCWLLLTFILLDESSFHNMQIQLKTLCQSPAGYIFRRNTNSLFLPPQACLCKRAFDQVTKLLRCPSPKVAFGLQELSDITQARIRNATLSECLPHLCQAREFVQQHCVPLGIELKALCCVFEKNISKAGGHNADAVPLAQAFHVDEPTAVMLEAIRSAADIHAVVNKKVGVPNILGLSVTHSGGYGEIQTLVLSTQA